MYHNLAETDPAKVRGAFRRLSNRERATLSELRASVVDLREKDEPAEPHPASR